MTKLAGIGVGVVLIALATACSSSDDDGATSGDTNAPATGATKDYAGVDAPAFCTVLTNCPSADPTATTSLGDCLVAYQALRFPPDCAQKLGSLTCTSTADDIDPNECFPPCTGTAFTCDGSHLTQCSSNSTELTVDCNALCTAAFVTWTGVCGTTFGTQTSPTPKCWCK